MFHKKPARIQNLAGFFFPKCNSEISVNKCHCTILLFPNCSHFFRFLPVVLFPNWYGDRCHIRPAGNVQPLRTGKVFPTTASALKQSISRTVARGCRLYLADCEKSQDSLIEGLTFHDLRHEATNRQIHGVFGLDPAEADHIH